MGMLPQGRTVAFLQFICSFSYISMDAWIFILWVLIHHISRVSVYSVTEIHRPLGVL